ncbi:DUF305 domain-containing protein [Streptomyces sp. NPDC047985]|uniref:DUF305 domain-containing protein n=1 Tax=unclassified Streptomyces TaxID=2593676 RepID=UPI003447EB8C
MTGVRRDRRAAWAAGSAVALALLLAGAATVASARDDGARGAHSPAAAPRAPGTDSADAGFARDMAVHHQQAVEMSFVVRDRTRDEEVRLLAYDIANTQANQRGMMLGWLDLWELPKTAPGGREAMAWMADGHAGHTGHGTHGTPAVDGPHDPEDAHGTDGATGAGTGHRPRGGSLMPGMATRAELGRLRTASGRDAEILYLRLMTDHHRSGVDMARGCVRLCTVGAEKRLARTMVETQRSELDAMAAMLEARGAKPRS